MNTQLVLFDDDENNSDQTEIELDISARKCVKCGKIKNLEDFRLSLKATNTNYRRPDCKECEKEYAKSRNRKERARLRPKIGTPCECCGKTNKALVYDHEHSNNQFRGWICQSCNIGIGRLGDSIAGIEKALTYLKNITKL